MLRVLILTGIFPPDIGGPATYVPKVAGWLAERGHHVEVVTLADDPVAVDAERPDSSCPYRVIRIRRRSFKVLRVLRIAWRLWALGRRADVLFVNGLAFEAACVNRVLRLPSVQKVVGDVAWERASDRGWTSDDFEEFQLRYQGPLIESLKALRSWWIRSSDVVVVPSRYLARWVERWGVPASHVVVIQNRSGPPDLDAPLAGETSSASGAPFADGVPERELRLVSAGRLVRHKRVEDLIEAVAPLEQVSLLVIGDGPRRGELARCARSSGLGDRVQFTDALPHEEALRRMATCDALVLSSTYEGFPHVVLEAMGLGLPVVATAVGGTEEIVEDGENGILVPPRSPLALRRAIQQIADDRAMRTRLAQGARRTRERFGDERAMLQATERLLTTVVSDRLSSPDRDVGSAGGDREAT